MSTENILGKDQKCIESIIEHWVNARIDGPMQSLARYDDAAKQLITIGSVLQGGLIAVFSVLAKHGVSLTRVQGFGVVVFELSLFTFLLAAAWACSLQPEMEATNVAQLLKKALQERLVENDLIDEVRTWCSDVEKKIKYKKRLMLTAKGSFIVCTITMNLLLLSESVRHC